MRSRIAAIGASVAFRHRPECSAYCALPDGRPSRGVRTEKTFRIPIENGSEGRERSINLGSIGPPGRSHTWPRGTDQNDRHRSLEITVRGGGQTWHQRRPTRRMFMLVIQNHPHRAGSHLRRELLRCLACHGSAFSRVGASGKPGAVHLRGTGFVGRFVSKWLPVAGCRFKAFTKL
jgi:hypothetical protein